LREARLLERRLFAACFLGAGPSGVVATLRGYRNEDGGFGHGLEPDVRCPGSLPIFVEVALQAMSTAAVCDTGLVLAACDYLARVARRAGAGGGVPPAGAVIEDFPHAAHWTAWSYEPALNPTAGLVGLLHGLGAEHPWREEATAWCWQQLEREEPVADAHTLSEVLVFLAHVPDRDRALRRASELARRFGEVGMLLLDPAAPGYGLTPLQLAPTADSPWRALFPAAVIDSHLERLLRRQQPDGGWPIDWQPPSAAAALEWRGIVTLQALRTLVSYGRLDPS
jgi:hypothetical protein